MLEVDDMRSAVIGAIDAAKETALDKIEEITEDAEALLNNNKVEKKKYKMTLTIVLDIDAAKHRTITPAGSVGWESVTKKAPFSGKQVPMTGDFDPDQEKAEGILEEAKNENARGKKKSADDDIPVQDGMTEPPEDYNGPRP